MWAHIGCFIITLFWAIGRANPKSNAALKLGALFISRWDALLVNVPS